MRPNTRAVYGETIGNPLVNVLDIAAVAEVAHAHGVPLVIDNTVASPYLCNPLRLGADIVVHSATKYLGGHGTTMGGVVVEGGKFPWDNGKFPEMVEPSRAYHGVKFYETFGDFGYTMKARMEVNRTFGGRAVAHERLAAAAGRRNAAPAHARALPQRAEGGAVPAAATRRCSWVNYPGLPGLAVPRAGAEAVPHGGRPPGRLGHPDLRHARVAPRPGEKFIDACEFLSHLANIGDAKTLVIHPASTTHRQLNDEELARAGVSADMVRLSWALKTWTTSCGTSTRRLGRAPCKTTPSCAPACASHRPHARVADAPGRPLPARILRHARPGRQLHGPGHQRGLRHRGDAAAAGPLPAGRGHPVQRHPDRARRHGPGPVVRAGRRPALRHPVRDEAAVAKLAVPDMDKLRYVFDAVTSIRKALNGRVPLIGFSGSPWTLACYMVEGGGSRRLPPGQDAAVQPARPDAPHPGINADAWRLPERADRRRRAGRDGVRQLGRRAGRRRVPGLQPGLHAPGAGAAQAHRRPTAQIVPRIVFTKGGGLWLEDMKALDCEVLGLDWTMNLGTARWRACCPRPGWLVATGSGKTEVYLRA
jgi:hypothetical protein